MEKFDRATLRCRYLTNNEINVANVEKLEERLKEVNRRIDNFNFKIRLYGDDCLNTNEKAKYKKLITQKEWIENQLKYSQK
jgi:hypothetical protein